MTSRSIRPGKATSVDLGKARMASLVLYEPTELLEALPLMSLEERCQEETLRYYRAEFSDGRYGYQLFRRAIVRQDDQAWRAVERVYQAQLVRWARCHRLYVQAGEEAEALANRALENLWRRVGAESFASFPNLNSILGYLQRSIYNLIIDQARMRVREQQRATALGLAMSSLVTPTPQGRALDRVRADEIWAMVRALCRGDREVRVAYSYLVLAMKPSDILAVFPNEFGTTAAINTVLATLLKRLRRNPLLLSACHEILAPLDTAASATVAPAPNVALPPADGAPSECGA
jgi:DNA-directed RNA polymerase specialized sigma24 family protein